MISAISKRTIRIWLGCMNFPAVRGFRSRSFEIHRLPYFVSLAVFVFFMLTSSQFMDRDWPPGCRGGVLKIDEGAFSSSGVEGVRARDRRRYLKAFENSHTVRQVSATPYSTALELLAAFRVNADALISPTAPFSHWLHLCNLSSISTWTLSFVESNRGMKQKWNWGGRITLKMELNTLCYQMIYTTTYQQSYVIRTIYLAGWLPPSQNHWFTKSRMGHFVPFGIRATLIKLLPLPPHMPTSGD